MSPAHKDAEGRATSGKNWPSLVERLIQEAHDRGDMDDLPGRGKPLRLDDDAHAGEWALGFRILRNAGMAPLWIDADRDVRQLREERDRLLEHARNASPLMHGHYRRELTRLVEAHDRAVDTLNMNAPSPRQHRRHLRLRDEMARLEEILRGEGS